MPYLYTHYHSAVKSDLGSRIDYALLADVRDSKRVQSILEYLKKVQNQGNSLNEDDSVDTATIARELGILLPNAIKYIRELEGKMAVEEVTHRKRGRRYRVTMIGINALEMVNRERVKQVIQPWVKMTLSMSRYNSQISMIWVQH